MPRDCLVLGKPSSRRVPLACRGLALTVPLFRVERASSVCFSPIASETGLKSRSLTVSLVFPGYRSYLPLHKSDFSLLCNLSRVFLGEPRFSNCFVKIKRL